MARRDMRKGSAADEERGLRSAELHCAGQGLSLTPLRAGTTIPRRKIGVRSSDHRSKCPNHIRSLIKPRSS